jgi:hypothetical protein
VPFLENKMKETLPHHGLMISGAANLPCGKAEGGGSDVGSGEGQGLCSDASYSRGSGIGIGSGAEFEDGLGLEDAAALDGKEMLFASGDTAYIICGDKIDFAVDYPPGDFWWTIEEAEVALAVRLLGHDNA